MEWNFPWGYAETTPYFASTKTGETKWNKNASTSCHWLTRRKKEWLQRTVWHVASMRQFEKVLLPTNGSWVFLGSSDYNNRWRSWVTFVNNTQQNSLLENKWLEDLLEELAQFEPKQRHGGVRKTWINEYFVVSVIFLRITALLVTYHHLLHLAKWQATLVGTRIAEDACPSMGGWHASDPSLLCHQHSIWKHHHHRILIPTAGTI